MTEYSCRYIYNSPLGKIILQGTGNVLINVVFSNECVSPEISESQMPVFQQAIDWLNTYFSGNEPGTVPPMRLYGTPFRLSVWHILQQIPYGHTVSYKDVANEIIKRNGRGQMSAQAVGNAIAHNPIAIFVPCHRVIGNDGSLTGYAGGLWRKAELLNLEHGNKCFSCIVERRGLR